MAIHSINYKKLSEKIDLASTGFLQAKEGEANELLSQVFDELLKISSNFTADTLKSLTQLMEVMHDAQQRRDHVYLVDILQHELPKYIELSS